MNEEAQLDLKKFGVRMETTCAIYTAQRDQIVHRMVCNLEAYVAGEKQEPYRYEVKYHFPASWWQHFKAAAFPLWLKRWFPVKLAARIETRELSVATLYPYLKSQLPRSVMGDRVMVMIQGDVAGSFWSDTDGLSPAAYRRQAKSLLLTESFKYSARPACPACDRLLFDEGRR